MTNTQGPSQTAAERRAGAGAVPVRTLATWLILIGCFLVLTGCSRPPAQPLKFNPAPWADGETTSYELQDQSGAPIGTALWTWRKDAAGWSQSYQLDMPGRSDRGEVTVDAGLRPASSWRELAGTHYEAIYGPAEITITTTASDGQVTLKTLKPPADGLDNDQTLQVQRALPLAGGYTTRYTDIIPTSGLTVPVILRVTGVETVTVPAGTFPTWRVVMDFGSGQHDAWYGQEPPYPMVKYRNRASGAVFLLRDISSFGAAAAPPVGQTPGPAPVGAGGATRPVTPLSAGLLLSIMLVQLPLMLLFPLAMGWWIRRRYGVGWAVFGAGALTFIVSQAVHLPLNWALGLLGSGRGVGTWPLLPMAIAAGLSAGICEEGARWLGLTFAFKRVRSWSQGLQYGAGHGGVEAIIFGLIVLVNVVAMIALRSLPPSVLGVSGAAADQLRSAAEAYWKTPWHLPVLAGLERVFAITIQIALASLVVRAVAGRQVGFLAAAIAAHTAVDAVAVWGARTLSPIWVEVIVAGFAVAALWLIVRLREEQARPAADAASEPAPTSASLAPRTLSDEELARRAEASRYE